MKISVTVKTCSKFQKIIKNKNIDYNYKIHLKNKPQNNKANQELIALLSRYFHIPINNVKIVLGKKTNQKIIKLQ
jgi:uncharacterized protein YggU (UPF0235/DUF167 family)